MMFKTAIKIKKTQNITSHIELYLKDQVLSWMTFMHLGSVEVPEIDISFVLAASKDLKIKGFYQNDMNYLEKVREKEMLFKGSNDILGI